MCGFSLDAQGMADITIASAVLAQPRGIPADLPICILVGNHDPLNAELSLVERYGEAGLTDVTHQRSAQWGGWDSNPRPTDYEPTALLYDDGPRSHVPTCLVVNDVRRTTKVSHPVPTRPDRGASQRWSALDRACKHHHTLRSCEKSSLAIAD